MSRSVACPVCFHKNHGEIGEASRGQVVCRASSVGGGLEPRCRGREMADLGKAHPLREKGPTGSPFV